MTNITYLNEAKEYFPYSNPRPDQLEVTADILEAINDNNYKYVILDAGTGFGKSGVARTLVELYSDAYAYDSFILTKTKQLQRQYEKETKKQQI